MLENLPAVYSAADLHLGHKNILRPDYDNRPFKTIEEHDAYVTEMCRPHPQDQDRHPELWLLGDVAHRRDILVKFLHAIRPYWSKIHLIRGNHDDRVAWRLRALFDSAHEAYYLRLSKQVKVYLSHYALRVWRNSQYGSFHLHGHSHGDLPRLGRSRDMWIHDLDYKPMHMRDALTPLLELPVTYHHTRIRDEHEA